MHRASSFLKLLVALAAVTTLSVVGASGVGAQTTSTTSDVCAIYASTASIGAAPASVTVGQVVNISGSGFPPNVTLTLKISLDGAVVDTREVTTTATGTFTTTYTTLKAGALRITTDFCKAEVSTLVTVSSTSSGGNANAGGGTTGTGTGSTGTGSTSLPPTGADSADVARIGVLLLAGGAVAVAATRRRRQANTTI